MDSFEAHITNDQPPYNPGSLLNAFSNSLTSPLLNKPFLVKGIYKKGKGVNYNGVYYDVLKDEFTDNSITLVVPEKLRYELKEGQTIEAQAFLSKRLSTTTGRIDLILTVSDLLSRKEKEINEEEVKAQELLQQKAKIGYKDIDGVIRSRLYQQKSINVTIIIGTTAIIDNDIKHQLKDAVVVYDIKYVKVNLTRVPEIIHAMRENDTSDILVIARGGGENIQIFDNLELSQQALGLKSIFVTAIGHAADEPLLQKLADKHFITPTALGQYFYDLYNRTLDEFNNSKAKLIADLTKQIELNFQTQVQNLSTRLETTEKTMQEGEKENQAKVLNLTEGLAKSKSANQILTVLVLLLLLVIILLVIFKYQK
ncbi:hypothetical protein A3860_18620 [Niastella vici]|uniref:Exonuclease VII large subunit C-terminal domain-containing protein n=1 Tax=Niastella vici TaxID=1703345 RepID=A0A1V9G2C7_9BACT|nr:exodeoxyribonuclease VII large subunit [Niastella vici]OQP64773.1 hypothetical protein A3860_18620 [Niastella vici]